MKESLEHIRTWMNESKFAEAEKALAALSLQSESPSIELLQLLAQSLLAQKKSLPSKLTLTLAENEVDKDLAKAEAWLFLLNQTEIEKNHRQVQFLKIRLADRKGRVDELHDLISGFQIYLYEKKIPAIPTLIYEMIDKYFRNDFFLRLQQLSLSLLLVDLERAENLLKELLLSTMEKSAMRGIRQKIDAIARVMDAAEFKGYLEVYRGLCTLVLEGFNEKANFKKLVEFVIYSDDFKFQVLALDLMDKHQLTDLCADYAPVVRSNSAYDFVYFEKYYAHLKKYFVQPRIKNVSEVSKLDVDLTLDEKPYKMDAVSPLSNDVIDDESKIYNMLKYQDYSVHELFEIATSFLQSEMPRVALKAVERILAQQTDDKTTLKACYLKLTCHLLLCDNRAAVDCALYALDRAQNQADILSFLYGEAEAYIRLKQFRDAKRVLEEIMSIDSHYRLTRERLENIDEI